MTAMDAHLMIVDDDERIRTLLQKFLMRNGFLVTAARDAAHARRILAGLDFDLIVLDIHMTPMDGVETLRRIRRSGKPYANIPVIALTADNAASTNAACMEAGADLFLTKPVSREELLRAISYLNQTEGARILSQ